MFSRQHIICLSFCARTEVQLRISLHRYENMSVDIHDACLCVHHTAVRGPFVPVQLESSDYIESWYLHEHSQPQVLLAKYKTTPLPCSVMFSRKPWLPCATVGVLSLTSSFSDQCSVLYWCKLCVLLLSPIVLLYETWVTSFALAALAPSYLPLELRAYLPYMFFYILEILRLRRLGIAQD